MNTAEIREAFLSFFESTGHTRVVSSSLIPAGDPTLLFANAGMVQFKDTFLGAEKRSYSRATTCQKCLRISGKHNDLENVGRTARHHTFFEMLGNFSFGDYFKKDAICFAWEFVTVVLKLPKARLWVTIYEEDDAAAELWRSNTDVDPSRILRRGKKDNFWAMGETGPCGPCSEIFYFLGDDEANQDAKLLLADDPLYVEIWNLVFMQFNRTPAGNYEPLPKPSVDTGMGLERVAAIKQGFKANYDSDSLRQIIRFTEKLAAKSYQGDDYRERSLQEDVQYALDVAFRVIADHVRAAAFLIADGISPASDGRGYVLRRLIRRACRHGRVLGFNQAFLYQVAAQICSLYGDVYPELTTAKEKILKLLRVEEEKFLKTLDSGLTILSKEVQSLKSKGETVLLGKVAFLLHDTYGFPLDMTEDILRMDHFTVDHPGFDEAMEEQRERSRSVRASELAQVLQRSVEPIPAVFVGYDYLEYESKVLGLFNQSGRVRSANSGDEIALIAAETPFYAESGGQVGDTGYITTNEAVLEVLDTQKAGGNSIVQICRVTEGVVAEGELIRLSVDSIRRRKLRVNHSATHLLHLALRQVLGLHVKQAGSRVTEHTLRFDFNHLEQPTVEQLEKIEQLVNQAILENYEILSEVLPIDKARESGAVALFTEKYGEDVRVIQIGPDSREFCGGTHAQRSGDIGFVKITGESAIAAGVRRIEAVAGSVAQHYAAGQSRLLQDILLLVNSNEQAALERVARLIERNRELEKAIEQLTQKTALSKSSDLLAGARSLSDGTKIITGFVENLSAKQLRELADDLRSRVESAGIALATTSGDKPALLVALTPNLCSRLNAGNLLKQLTAITGGQGGGKADLAQAGGGDPAKISTALQHFQELF